MKRVGQLQKENDGLRARIGNLLKQSAAPSDAIMSSASTALVAVVSDTSIETTESGEDATRPEDDAEFANEQMEAELEFLAKQGMFVDMNHNC